MPGPPLNSDAEVLAPLETEAGSIRGGRSMGADAAVLAVGSLLTQGAGVLSMVVLARLLPKAELGGYQQLLLVYAIVSPLLIAGVPAAIQFFVPREADSGRRRAWVVDAYVTLATLGVLAAGLFVLLRHQVAAAFGNDDLVRPLLAYAPFVFFSFVGAVAPNALIVYGRARTAALLGALSALVWITAVVVSAAVTETIDGIAVGLSVSAAINAIAGALVVRAMIGPGGRRPWRDVQAARLLRYGLPLALSGGVSMLGFQLDRLVVASHFSPSKFAVYAVGAIEVPLAVLVRQSINSVLVPAMSERHAARDVLGMAELWRGALRKSALVIVPAFAFLMALAPDVIQTLVGPAYHESIGIFRVYLLMMPIALASWGVIPMAAGHPGQNLWGAAVLLVVNGALAVALVGPLGLYGPALATPAAALASAWYFIFRIRRLLGLRLLQVLPASALARTLLITLTVAAPLLAVGELPVPAVVRLVLGAVLYAPAVAVALRLGGLIDDLDWGRLRRLGRVLHLRPA